MAKRKPMERQFYRPREIAEMTGMDIRTVYYLMDRGALKFVKPARKLALIPVEEYERWIGSFDNNTKDQDES